MADDSTPYTPLTSEPELAPAPGCSMSDLYVKPRTATVRMKWQALGVRALHAGSTAPSTSRAPRCAGSTGGNMPEPLTRRYGEPYQIVALATLQFSVGALCWVSVTRSPLETPEGYLFHDWEPKTPDTGRTNDE